MPFRLLFGLFLLLGHPVPAEEAAAPETTASLASAEVLPSRLGYLKLRGLFADAEAVARALPQAQSNDAYGLVLDLRGAGGDNAEAAADLASRLIAARPTLYRLIGPDGTLLLEVARTQAPVQDMPVMALTDGRTSGAAELLAALLKGGGRGGLLVGRPSAGEPALPPPGAADGGEPSSAPARLALANGLVLDGSAGIVPDIFVESDATPPDPKPVLRVERSPLDEELEHQRLLERTRDDAPLRRACEILLGMRALNIRTAPHD